MFRKADGGVLECWEHQLHIFREKIGSQPFISI